MPLSNEAQGLENVSLEACGYGNGADTDDCGDRFAVSSEIFCRRSQLGRHVFRKLMLRGQSGIVTQVRGLMQGVKNARRVFD